MKNDFVIVEYLKEGDGRLTPVGVLSDVILEEEALDTLLVCVAFAIKGEAYTYLKLELLREKDPSLVPDAVHRPGVYLNGKCVYPSGEKIYAVANRVFKIEMFSQIKYILPIELLGDLIEPALEAG